MRFIHEAKDDKAKGRLFAAARSGHVAVLIGSTGKMGVGTNVQNRLIAMHHIDCPWRPADLEQRDGRGIRQGNQNAEVSLYRYVVERSFDAYSWQTVGRKATFIAQVMRGRLDTRELEDIGDTALSAAEAKALASGNPLVLEKATADATFQKLRRQETAYHRAQSAVQHTRSSAVQRMESCLRDAELLRVAAGRTTDTSGDAFRMQVGSTEYDSRADAGAAIAIWVRGHEIDVARATGADLLLGRIAGHELHVSFDRDTSHTFRPTTVARLSLGSDVPLSGSRMPVEEVYGAGVGLVRAIENKTAGIERAIVKLENDAVECERVITEADTSLGKPFPHAAALREAKTRVAEVTDALAESSKPPAADAAVVARDTVSASYPVGSAVRGSSSPVSDRKAYDRSGSDRDRGSGL